MSLEESRRSLGILAVATGIVAAVACGGGYGSNPTPVPTPSTGGGGSAPPDVLVTIDGMLGARSYDPSPASVRVGQTVAWRNADSTPHTATGSGFDTGTLNPGQTSRPIAFTAAANVEYHCSFHPDMVGALSVTQ